ncbi:hypothetical protein RKD23_001075 [Streptomyces sp. SAI-170]
MTVTTAHTGPDAVILDYNGVIGLQPTRSQWLNLARTAGWPEDGLTAFQRAFWSAREPYDAGQLSDLAYWAKVLGSHPVRACCANCAPSTPPCGPPPTAASWTS